MLEGAFKYKMVYKRMGEENVPFVAYFNEYEKDEKKTLVKRVGPPGEEDWNNALAFMHFLKQFYYTTLRLSATKTCTSNLIWSEMVGLQCEIEQKMKFGGDPTLQRVASSMKLKFDKYWGSFEHVNKLVFVANALDPRFKLQMIKISFRIIGADPSRVEFIIGEVKNCLLAFYNEYRGVVSQPSRNVGGSDLQVDGCDARSAMMRDLLQERIEEQLVEISNEVDRYFFDPFESPLVEGFQILDWWKRNATRYPILSKIAKDIFAIPSSTVSSENAFSLGGRIVDPFRASLTPTMVEALVCTSDWLKAEEFSFYKEPTDEEVEFYRELEEMEAISTTTQATGASQASTSGMPPPTS